jgi:pimeloyl-ACP methyl ester carboxylesterase
MSLAEAVLTLVPIGRRMIEPLGFLRSGVAASAASPAVEFETLERLLSAAGLRAPRRVAEPGEMLTFDKVASDALAAAPVERIDLEDPEAAVAQAVRRSEAVYSRGGRPVRSRDGVQLSAFRGGRRAAAPVLVVGAPGTPVELISGWLRGLGRDRPVATWETRGLFGPATSDPPSFTIEAQLWDACAVLDDSGWPSAHVLAICGGAALALAFAAEHPARVRSLSLWFGDYELVNLAPKTAHQRNLQALMQMAVQNRVSSSALHAILLQAMTKFSEPDLAPLALYPYATPELLSWYCRMNHPIMSTDCSAYLSKVRAPSFVAYSPDDVTTHPEGSRVVARGLGAQLDTAVAHGHLHAFRGHTADVERSL